MYDKVKFGLFGINGIEAMQSIIERGSEDIILNNSIDIATGEIKSYNGSFGRFRIGANPRGVYIEGSLPSILLPNNIYTLNRKDTAEAINSLSSSLNLDMNNAKVLSLEFGTNFIMSKPINNYITLLGECPNLKRMCLGDTLYFNSKGKSNGGDKPLKALCFYDKIKQAKKEKFTPPPMFEDVNLLRYELRLNGRLSNQLKYSGYIDAETLYNEDFYTLLKDQWYNHYNAIRKKRKTKIGYMKDIKKPSDAIGAFIADVLRENNTPNKIDEFVSQLRDAKVFSNPNYYTRVKNELYKAVNNANITESEEDIKELDDAIKNQMAYK